MGYSPWGLKESDTTEQLTHTHIKSTGKNTWSPNFHFIIFHGDNSRFKKGKKKNLRKSDIRKKGLLSIKTIINTKSKFQTQIWTQILPAVKQSIGTELAFREHWPVATGDACSTSSCWLLILFIVMSIHVGFSSFFLQDLPKFIYPNASKKCCCFVWLLNHPLGHFNWILGRATSMIFNFEFFYKFIKPRRKSQ